MAAGRRTPRDKARLWNRSGQEVLRGDGAARRGTRAHPLTRLPGFVEAIALSSRLTVDRKHPVAPVDDPVRRHLVAGVVAGFPRALLRAHVDDLPPSSSRRAPAGKPSASTMRSYPASGPGLRRLTAHRRHRPAPEPGAAPSLALAVRPRPHRRQST